MLEEKGFGVGMSILTLLLRWRKGVLLGGGVANGVSWVMWWEFFLGGSLVCIEMEKKRDERKLKNKG